MPVADGDIALVEVRVIGQVVGDEVVVGVFGVPAKDGMDFVLITLLDHAVEIVAVLGLLATQPG